MNTQSIASNSPASQWVESLVNHVAILSSAFSVAEVATLVDDIADALLERAPAEELQGLWAPLKSSAAVQQSPTTSMVVQAAVDAAVRGAVMVPLTGGSVRRAAIEHFDALCGEVVRDVSVYGLCADAYWVSDRVAELARGLLARADRSELFLLWAQGCTSKFYQQGYPKAFAVIRAAMSLLQATQGV